MEQPRKIIWPHGKKFAFSIIDDTDISSYERIFPIYKLLNELGLRTTKTVWMRKSKIRSKNFYRSETMEDIRYAEYVMSLKDKGFEISFHGASMESSCRKDVEESLEEFRKYFGDFPKIHINHAENRDNLYWGIDRFDSKVLRLMYKALNRGENNKYCGHVETSDFFWGDLCKEHIKYVRNFCFDRINLLKMNPSMPYRNERCKYVNLWFSSIDAFEPWYFNRILNERRVDMLEKEGGVGIISTHFGKYFVENGILNPKTERVLNSLVKREGWFVPASEILDYLYENGNEGQICKRELLRMQYQWVFYKMFSKMKKQVDHT